MDSHEGKDNGWGSAMVLQGPVAQIASEMADVDRRLAVVRELLCILPEISSASKLAESAEAELSRGQLSAAARLLDEMNEANVKLPDCSISRGLLENTRMRMLRRIRRESSRILEQAVSVSRSGAQRAFDEAVLRDASSAMQNEKAEGLLKICSGPVLEVVHKVAEPLAEDPGLCAVSDGCGDLRVEKLASGEEESGLLDRFEPLLDFFCTIFPREGGVRIVAGSILWPEIVRMASEHWLVSSEDPMVLDRTAAGRSLEVREFCSRDAAERFEKKFLQLGFVKSRVTDVSELAENREALLLQQYLGGFLEQARRLLLAERHEFVPAREKHSLSGYKNALLPSGGVFCGPDGGRISTQTLSFCELFRSLTGEASVALSTAAPGSETGGSENYLRALVLLLHEFEALVPRSGRSAVGGELVPYFALLLHNDYLYVSRFAAACCASLGLSHTEGLSADACTREFSETEQAALLEIQGISFRLRSSAETALGRLVGQCEADILSVLDQAGGLSDTHVPSRFKKVEGAIRKVTHTTQRLTRTFRLGLDPFLFMAITDELLDFIGGCLDARLKKLGDIAADEASVLARVLTEIVRLGATLKGEALEAVRMVPKQLEEESELRALPKNFEKFVMWVQLLNLDCAGIRGLLVQERLWMFSNAELVSIVERLFEDGKPRRMTIAAIREKIETK